MEDRLSKEIISYGLRIKEFKENLETDVSFSSRTRLWPIPCMRKKTKEITV
jgi:hypothetical protein